MTEGRNALMGYRWPKAETGAWVEDREIERRAAGREATQPLGRTHDPSTQNAVSGIERRRAEPVASPAENARRSPAARAGCGRCGVFVIRPPTPSHPDTMVFLEYLWRLFQALPLTPRGYKDQQLVRTPKTPREKSQICPYTGQTTPILIFMSFEC